MDSNSCLSLTLGTPFPYPGGACRARCDRKEGAAAAPRVAPKRWRLRRPLPPLHPPLALLPHLPLVDGHEVNLDLAFTRYCYYQYCMVYGTPKGGRGGGRILPNSRAIVLQQCGQCRRAGRMNGRLTRAQTNRSQTISCKGQAPTRKHARL